MIKRESNYTLGYIKLFLVPKHESSSQQILNMVLYTWLIVWTGNWRNKTSFVQHARKNIPIILQLGLI